MSRSRKQRDAGEFGSDSFLDIVANIVGILIILIVIAGVRMSQTPLLEEQTTATASPAEAHDAILQEPPPEELPPSVFEAEPMAERIALAEAAATEAENEQEQAPLAESARREAYERQPQIDFERHLGTSQPLRSGPDPNAIAEWQRLQQQIQESRKLQHEQQKQMAQVHGELEELSRLLQTTTQETDSLRQRADAISKQQGEHTTQLARLLRERANLDEQLVLVQRASQPAESLRHTMVPVSKQVAGHEWHFEVREGKVSFIPLDELMLQLKNKVDRWADWIARYDKHEGIVGPVEGYSLEYKVSRQRGSLVDELSGGTGTFRVVIDRWELIPNSRSYAESLEQAIQPNSLFRSTLNRCSLDDTITFWVYPDSFELYQDLTKIAHLMGYQVAGRPLPQGRRIGGSPQGSKSFSQ